MVKVGFPLRYAYAKLGARRYVPAAILALSLSAYVVVLLGLWFLRIFLPMTTGQFWLLVAIVEGLMILENVFSIRLALRLVAPAKPWLSGARDSASVLGAWTALTRLPRDFIFQWRWWPWALTILPSAVAVTAVLGLRWYSVAPLLVGAAVTLLYGASIRFFTLELAMNPVVTEVAAELPAGAHLGPAALPLRWRLLIGVPAINVITGVIVAGLATRGHADLGDLMVDIGLALAVALTVSFELTVLLARSVTEPVRNLRKATDLVAAGDLTVRVPVVSTDETGALAGSFNDMVAGLQERETLRTALGTYVDPDLADRILAEGEVLEGVEVEVTVLFVDIRDFTAFAERASAREVVGELNGFYELVVPVLRRHGGHANKFIGDGLLGVFGAPDRMRDHADRAVAAAMEIADVVRREYGGSLRIGIGVNSGPVVAGTIGGGGHLEFTVIGDPVNTAARVESVTRETGDDVLVTEATRCLLTRDTASFSERGAVELKGKAEAVRLWAPQGAASSVDSMPRTSPSSSARTVTST